MIVRTAVTALLLTGSALLSAAVAHASSTLLTGPLPISATTSLRCTAVNLGAKPVQMTIHVVNTLTNPASETVATCGAVAPQQSCSTVNGDDAAGNVYCEIDSSGTAKTVRGTLMQVLGDGTIGATSDAR